MRRIYGMRRASVSYEHLPDARQTRAAMAQRIPPDVFTRVAGLLEARMEADEFAQLKKQFDKA